MKVIQPFFLGGGIGLVLALGLAAACFLSPFRKGLYLEWDPEISALRERMQAVRERATAAELAIAAAEIPAGAPATAPGSADSLKRVQAGAWKEYRHWRNRLGGLSRLHDRATPSGFAAWIWSMRLIALPGAAVLSLVPGLLLAWRGARRGPLPRMPKPPKARGPVGRDGRDSRGSPDGREKSKALSSFESAVKQVARIAATPPGVEPPAPEAVREAGEAEVRSARPAAAAGRKTEYLPEVPRRSPVTPETFPPASPEGDGLPGEPSPYEMPPEPVLREPENRNASQEGPPARPEGMETQILQLGPEGWGAPRQAPGAPPAPERPSRETLSMEDEDGEGDGTFEGGDPPSGTFMPPTTEVERVERRKAEVFKLARKGLTSSEISRRMRISQDQVEFIIRMRREKG